MIPRLVIGSKNPDKTAEVKAILEPIGLAKEIVDGLDWDDVEETGSSLEENALLKARAVVEATGLPAIADDTGLEVDALGGAPGVHTARFAGEDATYEDNVARLLDVMVGEQNRDARFRTVVALVFPDGVEVTAEGMITGTITETRRGSRNFGYDPVFEVDGRTLAEMGDEEKNEISHRARAIHALCESLGL
ncbi:MAG TPA: RdgB/HAM1 family non-canonical purine NTP pyrophosphatase [Acidimicrobiia bacterium]|nr:RdgB/HAM1 family non-canonical purine NTP pyrophosphatase [Acidimicrobiia bacterium]